MGEGLLARACRVVEAGVGSVVEGAERLTGPALMKQAVRDVQHVADDMRGKERRARRVAARAAEQARVATARAETLREEARYAIGIGREDLATAALSARRGAEEEASSAAAEATRALEAAQALEQAAAEAEARHKALKEELRAHAPTGSAHRPFAAGDDNRVARAEERFARAAEVNCTPDRTDAAGVAAISKLRREQAVADELAALKAGLDAPAPAPRRA